MRIRAFVARREAVFWMAVAAIALSMQWPMLKGLYYRTFAPEAHQSTIAWRSDLAGALDMSRSTGNPVLVDFYASWCPPCITMKHDVWPNDEIEREVTASYVPLQIDIDRDPAAAERYGVEGIPTILVLDAEGQIVRSAGYLSVSGMLRFLRENGKPSAAF